MSKLSLIGIIMVFIGVGMIFQVLNTQTKEYTNKPLGYIAMGLLTVGHSLAIGGVQH